MQKTASRKDKNKKTKSMTMSLLKKGMTLGSKYDVEVLIVVLNKATGIYHEFCTTDNQRLFDDMIMARLKHTDFLSYTLGDLPSLLREEQSLEESPKLRKQPRTDSPAPSDLSSQLSSAASILPQKILADSSKPPRDRSSKGVAGFLAMLQKNPPKKPPPTVSTTDSVADLPPPAPPSKPQIILQSDEDEDEAWNNSPSDFLTDP